MRPRIMEIGGRYNWSGQPERLIYLGKNWSGNGYWHQFALVSDPDKVWCELLDSDLGSIEETKPVDQHRIDLPPPAPRKAKKDKSISPRQERKQRKAAKRAQQREGQ